MFVVLSKGQSGYFPSDYVETFTPVVATLLPSSGPDSGASIQARALFDFNSTGSGQCSFKKGDVLKIVTKGSAGGWSVASTGSFPTDYVEFISAASVASTGADLLDMTQSSSASSSAAGKANSMDDVFAMASKPVVAAKKPKSKPAAQVATGHNTSDLLSSVSMDSGSSSAVTSDPFAGLDSSPSLLSTPVAASIGGNDSSYGGLTNLSSLTSAPSNNSAPAQGISQASDPFANVATPTMATNAVAESAPTPASQVYAKAKYTKLSSGPTELTIMQGDMVVVLKQESEWWYGYTLSGGEDTTGYFPGNYVEIQEGYDPSANVAGNRNTVGNIASMATAALSAASTVKEVVRSRVIPKIAAAGFGSDPEAEMVTSQFSVAIGNDTPTTPVWQQAFFQDLFADYSRNVISGDNTGYERRQLAGSDRSFSALMMATINNAVAPLVPGSSAPPAVPPVPPTAPVNRNKHGHLIARMRHACHVVRTALNLTKSRIL